MQLLCTWDCLARHSPKAIQVMLIGDSSVGHAAIAICKATKPYSYSICRVAYCIMLLH